jgi:hypothetical protein
MPEPLTFPSSPARALSGRWLALTGEEPIDVIFVRVFAAAPGAQRVCKSEP